MRTITNKTTNFTSKDKLNLASAEPLDNVCGELHSIRIVKAAIGTSLDEEKNEEKVFFSLHTADNRVFVGISATVRDQVVDIIEYINDILEEGNVKDEDYPAITPFKRKSKGGRDFITLKVD